MTIPDAPVVHSFERRAMGSPLRLAVHGGPPGRAETAWAAVSEEFERAEQAMSRFRDTSDLTRLNRAAGPDPVPAVVDRRLMVAVCAADRAGRITEGRFDARVIGHLERLGYQGAPLASDGGAAGPGDERWAVLERDGRLGLRVPVDLGGIGKGLTLRWARSLLDRHLPAGSGALIDAGGDIVLWGRPSDGDRWRIAIESPSDGTAGPAVIGPLDGAVATSSVRINRWQAPGGREVHHLIDPRTGEPGGDGLLSVTVAGPDPAWAEVWSKALLLEGAAGIAALARSRGLAAWWIRSDGRLEMTSPARVLTLWTAED